MDHRASAFTRQRYDDKAAPKSVVLCPATCTAAKADPKAKLGVEFGCVTRDASVK